ncbi:MAG: hypothetical protein HGA78_09575 [Nitrospirales bacterium]|nr:hypothetical protein [Nitrospirales bacterium]
MSKKVSKSDERQMALFSVHLSPQAAPTAGSLNISVRLKAAISKAISNSGKDISDICSEIYKLTMEEVSVGTMRKWSAPSADLTCQCIDNNRNQRWGMPAEIVPAFCYVTGDWEALFIQAEAGHFKALKGKDVVRAKVGLLKEEIALKSHELKSLEKALLKAQE